MIPRARTPRLGPIDRTRHRPADPKALVEHHRRWYVDHGTTVEIACDESGSEGEKPVGGVTAVFAHAAVRLDLATAEEYKADHVRRTRNRAALMWLLGTSGPIHGRGHVQLVDKRLLLTARVAAVYGHPPTGEPGPYNDALRARGPRGALDPLFPAVVRAVLHDHHPSLIGKLQQVAPGLRNLTPVASPTDARVRVADFLAGIARRTAEEELHGRRDDEVVALLCPYVFGDLGRPRPPSNGSFRMTLK
ncbi:NAD-dependent protein deacetylase of SIR2 family [Saccharothrix yanglingensis]|uniref:NAD-dependent protein deacetylase of SIR2 family n=1 Tax=Saccharothrix yanglingensis TaxID=659496 RepID=UPI0027D2AE51|nr:NAD-dependent protein deacetylase of SIR2 family [Saccharothrix yanglingensis]